VRLFLAINLPEAVKLRLADALEALTAYDIPARWVAADALHITLKFLGDVADSRVPAVGAALAVAVQGVPPFDIELGDLGAFPSVARPNILWVGARSGAPLGELHRRVDQGFLPLGFEAESRKFHPHVTVARVNKDGRIRDRSVMDRMRAQFDYKAVFRATSVDLMQSRLGRDRARYEIIEQMELH
jgi:2'-5' RNA ligase